MRVVDIPTSAVLLERLRHGADADAWTEFALRYRVPLLEFAEARGWHHVDIEGAVQETLRTVAIALPRGDYHPEKGRFRDWLLGILRDRLKTALRTEVNRSRREYTYLRDRLPECVVPETDAALWRKVCLRQALRMVLEAPAVAGRTRAVFVDYVLHGRPAEEVADAYGLTPNAVYQIRNRLIARLRKCVATLR